MGQNLLFSVEIVDLAFVWSESNLKALLDIFKY